MSTPKTAWAFKGEQPQMEPPSAPEWPAPLSAAAYCGIVGDLLDIVRPHSEADEAALVLQFLAVMGNLIGRKPYFMAQATRHYLNLFVCLVGATSRGRKGSSLDQVMYPLRDVDKEWTQRRVASGLSSGEGLIYKVRDAVEVLQPVKDHGRVTGHQMVTTDPGEDEKRLLVIEPEFGRVLQVIERERSTLSAVMRQAWDSGKLGNIVKNSPHVATGAHVSIVGHVTRIELDRFLTDNSVANGFSNRFLWVCVKRAQLLPEGGELHKANLDSLSRQLSAIIKAAGRVDEMRRDASLKDQWAEFYKRCARGKSGMFDSVTSRAEPQTMRIACLYALLDQCSVVQDVHLNAAMAVWSYCENSARFIFGDRLGDPTADEILAALRRAGEAGMTRGEIVDYFLRNKPKPEIERALNALLGLGLARSQEENTGGRPATRWFAI
jgi:uncharacterized protein DUF3987